MSDTPKNLTPKDYFGQCAPKDATLSYRIEAAAGMLCLADPEHLRQALYDAGLTVVQVERPALVRARDGLRAMFNRWHVSGPHATYDAPVIEEAILALDQSLRGAK